MEYKQGNEIDNDSIPYEEYVHLLNLRGQSASLDSSSQGTQQDARKDASDEQKSTKLSRKEYGQKYDKFGVRIFYLESIMEYIRTGSLDLKQFREDIKQILPEQLPKHERIYSEILGYIHEMEQDELFEAINIVVGALKYGKYKLTKLPHIYANLCSLKRFLGNDWQHGDVTKIVVESVKLIESTNNVPVGPAGEPISPDAMGLHLDVPRMQCDDRDKPGLTVVGSAIRKILTHKLIEHRTRVQQDFFEKISATRNKVPDSTVWELCRKLKIDQGRFFQEIEECDNLEKIITLSNRGIMWISRILGEPTYSSANVHQYTEKQPLEKIKRSIAHALQEAEQGEGDWDNLRITRYRGLFKMIDETIERLENTKNNGTNKQH